MLEATSFEDNVTPVAACVCDTVLFVVAHLCIPQQPRDSTYVIDGQKTFGHVSEAEGNTGRENKDDKCEPYTLTGGTLSEEHGLNSVSYQIQKQQSNRYNKQPET